MTCLTSIRDLTFPKDGFEVIVVDDGSDEIPLDQIRSISEDIRLTLVSQPNSGPAAARNCGARHARGKFLAFTDDDCCVDPRWLESFEKQCERTPDCMFGGRTENVLKGDACAITSQIIVDVVYRHKNRDPRDARFFASNNIVVSATRYSEISGFLASFRAAEDREFCDRWLHQGGRMVYVPEAVIYHAHRMNVRGFCRQHFTYGRGAYQYHKMRSERRSGSMTSELTFHLNLANWLVYPFRSVRRRQYMSVASLLCLWQVVNAIGFAAEFLTPRVLEDDPVRRRDGSEERVLITPDND